MLNTTELSELVEQFGFDAAAIITEKRRREEKIQRDRQDRLQVLERRNHRRQEFVKPDETHDIEFAYPAGPGRTACELPMRRGRNKR